MSQIAHDHAQMRRALELAELGRFGASPNPMVGAVVCDEGGTVAGEGYHRCRGLAHAETRALETVGEAARGGTLYVTLEPCNHEGNTPPCSEALIAAGITRVVAAMADPNQLARGGAERLRQAGIKVEIGLFEDEARFLNRRWLRLIEDGRPWVSLKIASSLDGRTATRSGKSKWITGPEARKHGLKLRESHDAILVGSGTILADDPRLDRRLGLNPSSNHRRVVLDSKLRTESTSALVRNSAESVLLICGAEAPAEKRQVLEALGVEIVEIESGEHGGLSLDQALSELARRRIASLLVEGGATVHGSFVDSACYDEVFCFLAPRLLGGDDAQPAVGGLGVDELDEALPMTLLGVHRLGDDVLLHSACKAPPGGSECSPD